MKGRTEEIEWVAEIRPLSVQLSLAIRQTFFSLELILNFLSSKFNEALLVPRNKRGSHYCVNHITFDCMKGILD